MAKIIIKEVIITILLCVAIVLVLGVLFYDYNPMNKIVPSKIAYATPDNIKEELQEEVTELEKTDIVYTIQGSDLNKYLNNKSYVKGNANPFTASSSSSGGQTGSTENNSIGTGEVGGNSSVEETGGNSTGTFWNDTGIK